MSALLPDGAPVDVTTDSTSYRPNLVALTGGGLVAIYQTYIEDSEDTPGPAVLVRRFGADLGPAGAAFQVVVDPVGNQSPKAVTATADGGFAVLWQRTVFTGSDSETTLLIQRFDAAGARIGTPITLDQAEYGGPVGFSGLESGEIAVVFSDLDTDATRLTVIDASGAISVDYQAFAGGTSLVGDTRMSVAGAGSELIYLRNTVGDRVGTSYTRDMELIAVNAEGEVNATLQVLDNKEGAGDFALARLTDGRIVVAELVSDATFENSSLVIYFADAGLTELSAPVVSLAIEGAGHSLADLVATPDGGFVALYGEQITTPEFDVEFIAVTLNAQGEVEGEPVTVNLDPEGVQNRGDGALLPDGDVAVIYESSSDYEIHLQRLSVDGDGGGLGSGGGGGGGSVDDPVIEHGGGGVDRIRGGSGEDRLSGRGGGDVLKGFAGDDVLKGQGGRDKLIGGAGDDRLLGGGGADKLVGNGGADALLGGGGRDRLFGGAGADLLNGGGGRDRLDGGAGADVFVLIHGGVDRVLDFEIGFDRLDVSADASGFEDLTFRDRGAGVLVLADGGALALIEGIDARDLSETDFLFS